MPWEPWIFEEKRRLARYANPAAAQWLPQLERNPTDLIGHPDGRLETARLLYDAVYGARLNYALEPIDFQAGQQTIRQPSEIFGSRRATCLDLAVLFGAILLEYELLPMIVLTRGHAFLVVSRTLTRREVGAGAVRAEKGLFDDGLATSAGVRELRALVDREELFALECTGCAYTAEKGSAPERKGRVGGRMLFERAVEAGREQLSYRARPPLFALDLHSLSQHPAYQPYPIELPGIQNPPPPAVAEQPKEPGPQTGGGLLTLEERDRLVELLGMLPNIGSSAMRDSLLFGVPQPIRLSLVSSGAAAADLRQLVEVADGAGAQQADGSWPIERVIFNAIRMVDGSRLAAELRQLYDGAKGRAGT